VFGWYDNEMGSRTHRLGELTTHVAKNLQTESAILTTSMTGGHAPSMGA
jgi:hypothetical protein